MLRRFVSLVVVAAAGLAAQPAQAQNSALFVATNSPDPVRGNEVVMFSIRNGGDLRLQGRFPTGGIGSGPGTLFRGDALATQGSMATTENGRFLLVTNWGTDDISVFRINRNGLVRTDVERTRGRFPGGVAVDGNLVYVLNTGGDGSVVGFRLNNRGQLNCIKGSERSLNAGLENPPNVLFSPGEIRFSPDGDLLAVIVKEGPPPGPGRIDMYTVNRRGRLSARPVSNVSNGLVPFAMNFDGRGHLAVVEAIGGTGDPLTAAVSTYEVDDDGNLEVITGSLDLGVLDSCWIVRSGRNLYTANFFSDSISHLRIRNNGSLTLVDNEAGLTSTEAFNLDLAVSPNGRYLYNVLPGVGRVAGFCINNDGSLKFLGEYSGLESTPDFEPSEPFSLDGGAPAGAITVRFGGGGGGGGGGDDDSSDKSSKDDKSSK